MSTIDEVKQHIDIVDLVSQYATLKRAGRDYIALCPFHSERTPSFHVSPQRQTWHCFGACSTGGDIFSFIMRKDGCDFREALRTLAERAGVTLEQRRDTQEDARRGRMFEINEAASAFFHASLLNADGASDEGSRTARGYLAERRMADHSLELFQIGYAPNSWDALTKHLTTRGYSEVDVRAAGLAVEGDRGAYDRFRHRLMFPIRDERGRVVGFGGRLLPGEALGAGEHPPKYVNTPQSEVFDKGAVLYGLDLARDAIRTDGCAVIVEGYMDVIAAHEHGYANVVASMGTALTDRQVTLLKRYTHNLVLALDADAAGTEAMIRANAVMEANLDRGLTPQVNWRGVIRFQETLAADIRVLTMPSGRDPDDVIRNDPDSWPVLVANAKPVLDYLFDALSAKHDLASPRERSALVSALMPMLSAISDRVVQSHYLQRLARVAQVDEATLRFDLGRARGSGTSAATERMSTPRQQGVRERREEFCMALLFRYPMARAEGEALDPGLFGHSENRALFEAWVGWADAGEPFEESLTPDLRPQYERILTVNIPAYDDDTAIKALRNAAWNIEQQRLRTAKRASTAALSEIGGDGAEIAERANATWQSGAASSEHGADDEGDPAAAFVEDMEVGLKVHQRILEQHDAERPAR